MKNILSVLLILVFLSSCANKQKGIPVIGIFQVSSSELSDATREGFIHGLKAAGYEDGKTIYLDIKNAEGDMATAQLMAQKFVSDKVDIIAAITTPCLQAALNATKEIPIVFGAIANPYEAGAGKSANDHRANVTGASATSPVFATLQLIKETNPQIKTIGVIWNPAYANSLVNVTLTRKACEELGFQLVEVNVSGSAEVYQAAHSLVDKNIDLFFTVFDHSVLSALESVIKVARQYKLPIVSNDPKTTERGIALGMGWNYYQNGVKSSQLAVRVLKGENPADIPFQGLDEKEMMINLPVAREAGLSIPDSLLKKAKKVIQ